MTYCAAPGYAPDFVLVVADRTPLSDSSSASVGTHPGTCSLRPPFNTTLLGQHPSTTHERRSAMTMTDLPPTITTNEPNPVEQLAGRTFTAGIGALELCNIYLGIHL